jgi:putative ABC transport system ATP-binding protein
MTASSAQDVRLLDLVSVGKTYEMGGTDGGFAALHGVDLQINRGEVVAIVGPSGSGKSTLLNLIGGLDRPTSGKVRILGEDLSAMSDAALTDLRRHKIGFVFQFFNLLPTLSVIENVMLPALLAGKGSAKTRERAASLLDELGLKGRHDSRPRTLSGGQMQRVAIARALLLDPPLILADEPTGNLDSKMGEGILTQIVGARTASRTVVIVTHDPKVAASADRVVTMKDGAIVEDVSRAATAS